MATEAKRLETVEAGVAERVRATNAARAQFLAGAFALTFVVSGIADGLSMGTLRHHGFMLLQLVLCLAVVAVVRWTGLGQRRGGEVMSAGIVLVSASGAAHLAQFGGFDGPWFYGSYTAPAIFIPILLSPPLRAAVTFGTSAAFTLVYWACRPDLFSHPMSHIPLVYLLTVSAISVGIGRFVHRLELAGFGDVARLELATALLEARLREDAARPTEVRREVARQLHDDVAQLITGARFQLDAWARRRAKDEVTTRLGEVLDELARRSRRMLRELREPPARGSLVAELERLRTEYREMGLAVDVLVADDLHVASPAQVDVLVSTAREALTNAVRHGGATEATVNVHAEAQGLALVVVDNGGGRAGAVREGDGLRGIRERVEGLGGTAELGDYEEGLRLSVTLPRAGGT